MARYPKQWHYGHDCEAFAIPRKTDVDIRGAVTDNPTEQGR